MQIHDLWGFLLLFCFYSMDAFNFRKCLTYMSIVQYYPYLLQKMTDSVVMTGFVVMQ